MLYLNSEKKYSNLWTSKSTDLLINRTGDLKPPDSVGLVCKYVWVTLRLVTFLTREFWEKRKRMDRAIAEYISDDLFLFHCFWVTRSWNISELLSAQLLELFFLLCRHFATCVCHYVYSQMQYFFWPRISHTNTKRSLGYISGKWSCWNNWILE